MYEKHFQLRERPFALSPDPDYLYPSRVHQEALSYLRYGVEGQAGFVVITGEIGSGKTTLLQSLLGRLDRQTTVARIVNTMLEPRELLDAVMLDFGMDPTALSKPVLLQKLGEFLVQQRYAGRTTLLVIDEAQNLSLPALEEIRMLSNLETEKSKLIQIVMVGQPELREKLALRQLEQLRQRITVSYHLLPLDADDTANYINHRLKRAAIGTPLEFPRPVTDRIHARSRGVPRIINVIADATLLFAYGLDRRDMDLGIVEEALAELDTTGVLASYQGEAAQSAGAMAVSVAEADEALRIANEARRREQLLDSREQQIRERERALAMQQRVLEEEARLLASARAAQTAAAPRAEGRAPIPGGHAAGVSEAPPARAVPPTAPLLMATPAGTSVGAPMTPATVTVRPNGGARAAAMPTAPLLPERSNTQAQIAGRRVGSRGRYEQPAAVRPSGFWAQVRRVLFGVEADAVRE